MSIAPLLPLEGRIQIHRTDKMLCKVTNHSKTLKSWIEERRRWERKKIRKWEISGMGKWRSWTNRGMREILLLVELDVNPTWISKKGEAEKKFFLADIKLGKSWIYRNVYRNVLNPNVLRASVETDRSWQRHCGLEITDEGTIGYKMKKGKFWQGKIPTYSRASVDGSQADRGNAALKLQMKRLLGNQLVRRENSRLAIRGFTISKRIF